VYREKERAIGSAHEKDKINTFKHTCRLLMWLLPQRLHQLPWMKTQCCRQRLLLPMLRLPLLLPHCPQRQLSLPLRLHQRVRHHHHPLQLLLNQRLPLLLQDCEMEG
jgi:hypothetical protein